MGSVFSKPKIPQQSKEDKAAIEEQKRVLEQEKKDLEKSALQDQISKQSGQQGIRSLLGGGAGLSGFRSGSGRGLLS